MIKEKFKTLISSDKKDNKNNKKQIENLVIFVIILIITVIAINYIWKDEKEIEEINSMDKTLANVKNLESNEEMQYDLEYRLEYILEKIQGVGEVEVLLNYSETSTVVAMYNENVTESSTEETDSSGGIRTIIETDTKKEVVYSDEEGNSNPVTEKVVMPQIEGAIITAKGASNANIKSNIIEAVKAVTGLASHKIQVFEMSK